MMESSTEELARSQLEKLYTLGVLERNSDDDEWQHSENRRVNARHDAFLAALPPPSMFPLNMLQYSVNSDSSRSSGSSRSGDFYSRSGSAVSSQLLLRKRSQRSSSLRSSRSSGSSYSAQPKTRHRRVLRMWFRQWKGFTRYKREKTRRRAAAIIFLKQKIFTKWAAFLKRRRYQHEQKRLLDSWRVSRAISHWLQWKQRCYTFRNLLNGGRNSLMGRLIQKRIWRRWIQFTKRRKYIRGILSERKDKLHRRLTRFAWTELRIHSFQARQEALAVHRCLKAMRDFAGVQERKRLQCAQYQQKVNIGRKRELLQRWRSFAYASNRNRRLAWRVQFDIRRRRYFLLWCEVSRTVCHVERLRSIIAYRELLHHFSAWRTMVKAVQLGDRVKLNGDKRIQALYFRAFKDQLNFNIHCNHVRLALRRRRLAKAVRFLHASTTERRQKRNGICRLRNTLEKRLLRRVWVVGWLTIHRHIQAAKHGSLVLNARYFKAWKRFHDAQQTLHLREAEAESLHCKLCCRLVLEGWKAYHKLSIEHDQRLIKAKEHYRRHLLRKGVLILWDAVYENARNSLRGHQLRQNLRTSLKKRHFRAWHSYIQSKQRLSDRLHCLQASVGYRNSVCNPRRRAWDRWVVFLSKCRQRHHCARHFQARVKLRVLNTWRQQAKMEYQLRVFTVHKHRKTVEICFGLWKARANQWKKVAVICELAEKVYVRKLFTRVMREWLSRSDYLHRVRLRGESIRHQFVLKTLKMRFVEWQTEVEVHQCSARLKRRREYQLLQKVFTSWYKCSSQQNKLTRKLAHFQQVFGKHPASSLVSCTWSRWKRNCNQSRCVQALHRKHHLRQAKVCWAHWKFFHVACSALRAWHRVARALSTSNNRLGLRLRGFRRSRRYRLQKSSMDKWKTLMVRRRAMQEQQSLWRHKLHRELEESSWKLEQAIRMRLGIWFRRFCTAHNKDNALARRHYSCHLLSNMITLWWKAAIHSKQEKVLVEAQKTMGKLSYYHPQQQIYATRYDSLKKQTKKMSKRKESTKVVPIDANIRVDSMLKMRRMLDPTEYASYSRFYQESGREVVRTKPDDGTAKPLRGKDSIGRTEPVQQREYNHRNGTGSRGQDECDRGHVEKEADDCSSTSGNGNHFCGDNEANFRLQHDMEEHFYREQCPGSPGTSDKPSTTYSTIAENVLPLFDGEKPTTGRKQNQTNGHIPSTSRRVHFAPDPPSEQTVNIFLQPACVARNGSIVPSVPDPEHKGHRQSPRALTTASCVNAPNTNTTTPRIFDASSSLIPASNRQSKSRVVKSRKSGQKNIIKVANSRSTEVRPLADILKLSDAAGPKFSEYSEDHSITQWRNSNIWDAAVLKEVVAFYVSLIVDQLGRNNGVHTTRLRVCFRIARDLALLQNDFYIDELQKVYDANFKEKPIDLTHCGLETFKYQEQLNLELFLEQLVNSHPSYRKCVGSKQSPDPLNWLAQYHLQPQVRLQAKARGHTRQATTFWIWELMPADMDVALEKLLPAITKYMRVLGQFFLRGAVRSSSTGDKPQDYRISSTAFISLMKQVRVFPQLFHRRELENAVCLSCQSSPDTEELNFPEFIEALVRCSCKLRWGELDGGKHTAESSSDTVVVIKFVMLIFAMEGQGSVLKKRSEDVGAILGFLGQRQKKNQAEKLFRFRKMLADNKRRTRASRSHQPPSVWNQIRLQFSPRSSPTRSRTRSDDTFDELTESWDGGSPHRVSMEPFVFDAHTNDPFDVDSPPSPNVERQSDQQQQPNEKKFVENAHSNDSIDLSPPLVRDSVGDVTGPREGAIQQASTASQERQTSAFGEENVSSEYKSTAGAIRIGETVLSDQRLTTEAQSTGLVDPKEKDDFLREIMDNIGDVELMLSQARFADTKLSRQSPRKTLSDDSIQCTKAIECFPSLSELAGDGHWQHHTTDIFSSSEDAASEVQVRDPMLNYLTDIERFTESADHSSLVAIAGIAGIPFTRDPPQDFLAEPHSWASQEIRPTEEVTSNSTHASNTI